MKLPAEQQEGKMISERPWTLRTTDHQSLFVESKEGHCFDISDTFFEEAEHFVACVNAIHAAGIHPQDVAVFVEAVRAHAIAKSFMDEAVEYPNDKSRGLWRDAVEKTDAAAALLPERKSE